MKKRLAGMIEILILAAMLVFSCTGCNYSNDGFNPSNGSNAGGNTGTGSAADTAGKDGWQLSAANVYPENGLPKYEKVVLKVGFFISGYGREWYDICTKKFTEKFPNVTFDTVYSEKIYDIAKEKIAAGNDEDMFDFWYGDWRQLAENGKIEPMDDLLDRSLYDTPDLKLKDVVRLGMFDNIERYDGSIYVLPHNMYIGGLFYDKHFFEKNNWNQDPKTWDEFMKLCSDIKQQGVTPLVFSGKYPYYLDYSFTVKMFDYAQSIGDKDFRENWRERKEPQFTSTKMAEVWKRLYNMGKQGYFYKDLATTDHIQAQSLILQHKVALVSTCDWVGAEMKRYAPDGYEWGYMAVPFGNDPDQTVFIRNGFNNDFVLWKAKPDLNKKWSKEFMLWLMNLDSQKIIAEKGGALPIRNDLHFEEGENLQSSQKAVLNYINTHKVQLESMAKNSVITGYNTRAANELVDRAYVSICLGESDSSEDLKRAEELIQKDMVMLKK